MISTLDRLQWHCWIVPLLLALFFGSFGYAAEVRVDRMNGVATPTGTPGDSWGNAFKYLQDALTYAATIAGPSNQVEIWVAAGTYKPDEDAAHNGSSGDRNASFQLHSNVRIYGGFRGGANGETDKNQRDPAANVTILSGEIGNQSIITDNSYHVVMGLPPLDLAILDGFTIRDGDSGGASAPTLAGCVLCSSIPGDAGGGIYIRNFPCVAGHASPTILRCTITNNISHVGGGAFIGVNQFDTPQFIACTFAENGASAEGGAVQNWVDNDHSPCDTESEEAVYGGNPQFINCLFRGNTVPFGYGGAISCDRRGSFRMVNCTLVGNSADDENFGGGAIWHGTQCNELDGAATILNCIVWDNGADPIHPDDCVGVTYSTLEVLISATGNTDSDPQFESSTDFHLQCGSPCINTGNASNETEAILYAVGHDDYDIDQNTTTLGQATPDLDLQERAVGPINRGCYEKQLINACYQDITGDGVVNVQDLLAVIGGWGPAGGPADIVPVPCGSGTVDVQDLLAVVNGWGACPGHEPYDPGSLSSVQDCMDAATNRAGLTPHSPEWNNFVNKCVEGLCEAHIINCD